MKAAVFKSGKTAEGVFLEVEDVDRPQAGAGNVLLRVVARGVCRTDLHIVEGDLPPIKNPLIPGHQIVGEVSGGATATLPLGTRVGVSWIGGVDGDCWYCRYGMENLCDQPTFTGYTVNGGYAEYARVREDFAFPRCQRQHPSHAPPNAVWKQSRVEGETANRHAAGDGPLAVSWVIYLGIGEWSIYAIKAQSSGYQHLSAGQQRGAVAIPCSLEAAGKRSFRRQQRPRWHDRAARC